MTRCVECGSTFTAKNANHKLCSNKCRYKRSNRGRIQRAIEALQQQFPTASQVPPAVDTWKRASEGSPADHTFSHKDITNSMIMALEAKIKELEEELTQAKSGYGNLQDLVIRLTNDKTDLQQKILGAALEIERLQALLGKSPTAVAVGG